MRCDGEVLGAILLMPRCEMQTTKPTREIRGFCYDDFLVWRWDSATKLGQIRGAHEVTVAFSRGAAAFVEGPDN